MHGGRAGTWKVPEQRVDKWDSGDKGLRGAEEEARLLPGSIKVLRTATSRRHGTIDHCAAYCHRGAGLFKVRDCLRERGKDRMQFRQRWTIKIRTESTH